MPLDAFNATVSMTPDATTKKGCLKTITHRVPRYTNQANHIHCVAKLIRLSNMRLTDVITKHRLPCLQLNKYLNVECFQFKPINGRSVVVDISITPT